MAKTGTRLPFKFFEKLQRGDPRVGHRRF